MQDADLFLSLAGIAGVFVGFGALMSVRSGGPRVADEVSSIRCSESTGRYPDPTLLQRVAVVARGFQRGWCRDAQIATNA